MDTPVIRKFYSCREMSDMHGGNPFPILPDSKGKITNIRALPNWNPDGPEMIEYGPPPNRALPGTGQSRDAPGSGWRVRAGLQVP